MFRVTRGVIALAIAGALVGGNAQAAVSDADRRAAKAGARFLVDRQSKNGSIVAFSAVGSTADAIVALAAANRGPRAIKRAYGFLERRETEVNNVGLKAKVALALEATGRSPRNFAGRNLIAEIVSTELPNGQYGEDTPVFDQAHAILAVIGAGEEPSQEARRWLADAQCDDGGWEYKAAPADGDDAHCFSGDPNSDFFTSDTNTTSFVVQALEAAGGNTPLQADPIQFLLDARDERKNGWGYVPNTLTEANSTALAIQAFLAAGEAVPPGSKKALRALQWRACEVKGGFAYTWQDEDEDGDLEKTQADVGATIAALPALLEKTFPVAAPMPSKNPRPLDCQA